MVFYFNYHILLCFIFILLHTKTYAVNIFRTPTMADVDYLRMYGYLTDKNPGSPDRPPDSKISRALKGFQRLTHLEITGVIDEPTARQMNRTRCGCADIMMEKPDQPLPFTLGTSWSRTALTWKVTDYNGRSGFTYKLDREVQRREFRRAFKAWSDVTPLTFREITDQRQDADLNIFFASGVHGDGTANGFDGSGRVLAHAFFPENGRIHFDEDENWVISSDRGIDLFTVAAHEFGHALGLGHSEVSEALMAPFYAGYDPDFTLHRDDINGIQQLYGPGVATAVPPTIPTIPVRTRPPVTTRPTVRTRPPAVTTRLPPPMTTLQPRLPSGCNIVFKGFIRDIRGDSMGFWDRYVATMTDEEGLRDNDRVIVRSKFPRAPRYPDAVFNIMSAGRVYIIRGMRIWQYKETFDGYEHEGRFWIGSSAYEVPERPRAVLVRSSNEIYFLGRYFMWQFNPYQNRVLRGTYVYISNAFRGLPFGIELDAAVMWDPDTAFFFVGSEYYKYDFRREALTGPFPVGPAFIKGECGDAPK